ncbi:U40 [Human betaherpesvirus 6A]|uniref:DNA packaging terminase subunit 2 n=1 Tax=Human betaherpesvirus 6A TaxID=32603 RepID=A0A0A7RLY6_9BETA|nr:U40 [Human betaherpesvirus 6A]APO38424.1 DNA packaging terminase subunit 2 [Human betaherpesvirus 6A]APO38595.1 DNA packaging terminase subunit 2 [Human betaherpesvirus 6A]AVK93377.1 U40 [Human betaherpesvirus 6A]AVK93663.1 U40 [Human betaherpesvirus 6A]
MNSLQSLCVLCARLNECALDLECLKFCDPVIVLSDMANFKKNGIVILHLYQTFFEGIKEQNLLCASALTVYMQVLLKAMYEQVLLLDAALESFMVDQDRKKYFEKVLCLRRCAEHLSINISLNNGVEFIVQLSTLNDIEQLISKINSVYALLLPQEGLQICGKIIDLLTIMCGACMVAKPESYLETKTCMKCYEELTLTPNQGKSLRRRLHGKFCNHLTEQKAFFNIEKNIETIEKDLGEAILNYGTVQSVATEIKKIFKQQRSAESLHVSDAEKTLKKYNIFSKVPDVIYSLSEFTYWSKISETIVRNVAITLQQLNSCHTLYKQLQNDVSLYLYGEVSEDFLALSENLLTHDERLYVGSIYVSPSRLIDLVTGLSIKNLEESPIFKRLAEEDEVQHKIKSLLHDIRDPQTTETPGRLNTINCMLQTHNLQQEVLARKKAYFQKVSESGYNRVMACIREQESLINKVVSVNVYGNFIFEALSKIMNGFVLRKMYLDGSLRVDSCTYDEHLYIKNNLMPKKLPLELLPDLSEIMYTLLTGPLSDFHKSAYPLPANISMAYGCDHAEMLPHMKEDLARCIEGTIHPSVWMVCEYNEFFNFSGVTDVNDMQKKMWNFIRELTLSVALYNDVFGKRLKIVRIDEEGDLSGNVVLTFNHESPLLFHTGGGMTKFKDVYSLLYCDLQAQLSRETVDVPEGVSYSVRTPNLLDLVRENEQDGSIIPGCLFDE